MPGADDPRPKCNAAHAAATHLDFSGPPFDNGTPGSGIGLSARGPKTRSSVSADSARPAIGTALDPASFAEERLRHELQPRAPAERDCGLTMRLAMSKLSGVTIVALLLATTLAAAQPACLPRSAFVNNSDELAFMDLGYIDNVLTLCARKRAQEGTSGDKVL